MTPLAPDLSAFLQNHLPNERGASPHTIASLRACVHAPCCVSPPLGSSGEPSELMIEDLDVGLVRAFLEHIEEGRDNTARSRNDGWRRSRRSFASSSNADRLASNRP